MVNGHWTEAEPLNDNQNIIFFILSFLLLFVVQDFCEFEDEKVEQADFFRRKLIQSYNL